MQQTFSSKQNLCYDTKAYYYEHIIKVVLEQVFPHYTYFPDKKIQRLFADFFLTFCIFPNIS